MASINHNCKVCKINTKKLCATCTRAKFNSSKWRYEHGEVSSSLLPLDRFRHMARWMVWHSEDEEEYY